jgi:hypothetical protein
MTPTGRPALITDFGEQDAPLRYLLARIERLTEDDFDHLAQSAATTRLLETTVDSTGLAFDQRWFSTKVLVDVAFGHRCGQLEPQYDVRDEWSMSPRSVMALRACWMAALAIIARDRLTDELAASLTAAWDALPR